MMQFPENPGFKSLFSAEGRKEMSRYLDSRANDFDMGYRTASMQFTRPEAIKQHLRIAWRRTAARILS